MKVIITGATGMVGEGVLLECLQNDKVEAVLSISRRTADIHHPKLKELLVKDFRIFPKLRRRSAAMMPVFIAQVSVQ